jgi:hypothetical protein
MEKIKNNRNMTIADVIIKVLPSVVMISGILIGVWQFNAGQKSLQNKEIAQRQFELKKMLVGNQFEAIAKFKEIQSIKYKEATEIISNIIYAENYQSEAFKKNLKRFWQIYWVELSAIEDKGVESAMVSLGNYVQELDDKGFNKLSDEEKVKMQNLGYSVAQSIKKSSKTWELPEGFNSSIAN